MIIYWFILAYICIGLFLWVFLFVVYLAAIYSGRSTEEKKNSLKKITELPFALYIVLAWPHYIYLGIYIIFNREKIEKIIKDKKQVKTTSNFQDKLEKIAKERGYKKQTKTTSNFHGKLQKIVKEKKS